MTGTPDFLQLVVVAVFMATVANRLVEMFVKPLYVRFQWDQFSLLYVSAAVSAVLVWLTGVNLFAGYIPSVVAGQILTAIVAGGGANFIDDLFGKR